MKGRTNARLAGFMFLFYIAIAITEMVLAGQVTSGKGTAAKLANIAQHAPQMRLVIVLLMLTMFAALTLAVALYGLTRDVDPDLAVLALMCRVIEGGITAVPMIAKLGLLSLATTAATAVGPEAVTANALAALLLRVGGWSTTVGATAFAVGSTIFSYLFLRARSIPVPLAWLGVIGSLLMIVILPLDGLGLISGAMVWFSWMPLFVFEVTLGLWLLIKGVAEQPT
jgi:hypothetical protein